MTLSARANSCAALISCASHAPFLRLLLDCAVNKAGVAGALMPLTDISGEVGGAVVYLLSDAAAFVTGSALTVDGGMMAGFQVVVRPA